MKLAKPFLFEESERAVILFHAFTGSSNDVRMLGRRLQRDGYTVYAPHLSGHATENVYDLVDTKNAKRWVADGQAAYDFLQGKGYKKIVALGLSLGGSIATSLIFDRDLLAAGSFCTPIMTDDMGESNVPSEFIQYAKRVLQQQGTPDADLYGQLDHLKQDLKPTLDIVNAINQAITDRVSEINLPYYIASAGQDEFVDANSGKKLAEALVSAPVDYNEFPESGHVITVDKCHKEFEETVVNFLAQLDWT